MEAFGELSHGTLGLCYEVQFHSFQVPLCSRIQNISHLASGRGDSVICSQSSVIGLLFLHCHPLVSCMRLSLLMPVYHSEPPVNQASMYNHLAGLGRPGHLTGTFWVNSSPVPCVPASNGCRVLLSAQVGCRIPPSPGGRVKW